MSRYRGPRLRLQRRLGVQLSHLTRKRVRNKKRQNTLPGQHGYSRKKVRRSEYRMRLEEKQKLRFNYCITEAQLFRYVKEARRRKGVTGLILLQLLEMRLDTLCFTLGFAKSITQARQLVNHGHITVNKEVINIPSFQCRLNDLIGVKEKSTSRTLISNNIKSNQKNEIPSNLKFDDSKVEATVIDYCERDDIQLELDELLVIEYYSRR